MRNITFSVSILLFCCFAIFSCQKIALKPSDNITNSISPKNSLRLMASGSGGIESADFIPQDEDSIERETVLGYQLTNPYTITNMQHAYGNLGLSSSKAVVNNLYVRFLPTINQLAGYGIFYYPNGINHTHIDVLENFNPNLTSDPFKWIPKGLFYDLFDPANEIRPTTGPVTDAVSDLQMHRCLMHFNQLFILYKIIT
ncbi:MAG: hypothetical protein ABI366_04870 [Ginsengibacter sp.]